MRIENILKEKTTDLVTLKNKISLFLDKSLKLHVEHKNDLFNYILKIITSKYF